MCAFKEIKLYAYAFFKVAVLFLCLFSAFGDSIPPKDIVEKSSSIGSVSGVLEVEALAVQQKFLDRWAHKHLQEAGLKAGMVTYDVGCGDGTMTIYLARHVGSSGHVFAIDESAEKLNVARQNINKTGLRNVTFIRADVQELEQLPSKEADIIFFRYLLVHVPEPMRALKNMYQRLKVGGKLAFQEPVWSITPRAHSKVFLKQYKDAVNKLVERKGVNYSIGDSVSEMSRRLPNSRVESNIVENKFTVKQYRQLALVRLDEIGKSLISTGLINIATLLKWKGEIESMPNIDIKCFISPEHLMLVLVEKIKVK